MAAGRQPGGALPGGDLWQDQEAGLCAEGALCCGAFSRCAGQGLGAEVPEVPSQARGCSSGCGCAQWKAGCFPASVGLWEGGVFAGHLPACLPLLGGLTCPGLVSTLLSVLALGPVLGHAGTTPTVFLLSAVIVGTPPRQTSCSPWGHRCPTPGDTYTLPPPGTRSAASWGSEKTTEVLTRVRKGGMEWPRTPTLLCVCGRAG